MYIFLTEWLYLPFAAVVFILGTILITELAESIVLEIEFSVIAM